MTQVLSVSANTAAYASEAIKPPMRVSRHTDVEIAINELARKANQSDDVRLKAILSVVKPPALSLYFLTAGREHNHQATLDEASSAYKNNDDGQ